MASSSTPPKTSSSQRIQGLDGLRALAVIAVVAYHLAPGWLPGGYIGVDIFFVISGFLITTLLISEHVEKGKIDLKRFWTRRARRLLPALIAAICIASSAAFFIGGDMLVGLGRQILGAGTFSNNWLEIAAGSDYFNMASLHLFTNFWSLAVEEQFYLLWPFVLIGVLGWSVVRRKRFALGAALCLVLAIASAVHMALAYSGTNATRVYYGTDTHLFGLMLGAAMAFWGHARYARAVATDNTSLLRQGLIKHRRWLQVLGFAALIGLGVIMVQMPEHSALPYRGGLALASLAAAALILATITYSGWLQKLFTAAPLEWIGVRSYGIYLWHWPLFILIGGAVAAGTSDWVVGLGTAILTLAVAALSYRFIEMPIRMQGFKKIGAQLVQHHVQPVAEVKAWKLVPHPAMAAALVITVLTVLAVTSAPTKTQAQRQVEAGQRAIALAKPLPVQAAHPASSGDNHRLPPAPAWSGPDITLVGDSVALASAPALQTRYPGILIDAQVSRSLPQGGLSAIESLVNSGQMRRVAIIALGTNGYYGEANLDRLMQLMGTRSVIFVTSHAPADWSVGNNTTVHALAARYHNVRIAEWDTLANAHPEALGPDGIHPNETGETFYTDAISTALAHVRPARPR